MNFDQANQAWVTQWGAVVVWIVERFEEIV